MRWSATQTAPHRVSGQTASGEHVSVATLRDSQCRSESTRRSANRAWLHGQVATVPADENHVVLVVPVSEELEERVVFAALRTWALGHHQPVHAA